MSLGFYAYKRGILNQEVNEKLSALIVRILCPCIILNSISSVPREYPELVWKLFACGAAMYLSLPLLARLFAWVLRVPSNLKGTCMCMLVFSNCSFMGYPVVEALYGSGAIFYMTIFNMPFNFIFYSLAFRYIRKDAGLETMKVTRTDVEATDVKVADKKRTHTGAAGRFRLYELYKNLPPSIRASINPGTLFSLLALLLYFLQISLPELLLTSIEFVGNVTTPLSMILVGSSLAASSFAEIRTEKTAWMLLPIRLLLVPAAVWFAVHHLTADATLTAIATLSAGMPVGSLVAIASVPYPRQNKLASIGVAVSTICSLATIPLLVTFFHLK